MAMGMVARDERVPRLDTMRKSLTQKEIQRPVYGDGGGPPAAFGRDMLNQIISPEGLRAGGQQLQHLGPHRRQALAALRAQTFRPLEGGAMPSGMISGMVMGVGHAGYVTLFRRVTS